MNTLCVGSDTCLTDGAGPAAVALFDVTVVSYDGRVTTAGASAQLDQAELEGYRRELTAHCYRMLGSSSEAEDAVQDTYVRAWKAADSFEGRSSVRTWLYRIATNICIDMSRTPQRRARPVDLGPASAPDPSLVGGTWSEPHWLTPIPDDRVASTTDPAAAGRDPRVDPVGVRRRTPAPAGSPTGGPGAVRGPPLARHRGGRAARHLGRVGQQRAATSPAPRWPPPTWTTCGRLLSPMPTQNFSSSSSPRSRPTTWRHSRQLLRDDVRFSMPPYPIWFEGPDDVVSWISGPGIECKDGRMLSAGSGNGCPAFASYRKDPAGGYSAWALHILEIHDGHIASWTNFLDPDLFPAFGVPRRLDEDGGPDHVVSV